MKHYICLGECQGISDKPGTCQMETCSLYHKPLVECNCEDGKHEEVKKANGSTPPQSAE